MRTKSLVQIGADIESGFPSDVYLWWPWTMFVAHDRRQTHGSRKKRDPFSPAFHGNFIRGLRMLEFSATSAGAPMLWAV